MSGIVNSTGARSGVIGTTVGTPPGGLTEADMWRIECDFDSYLENPITANWERTDTGYFGLLGTGMTTPSSSGAFAFPSEGHWLITFQALHYSTGDSDKIIYNVIKTYNGSTWKDASYSATHLKYVAANTYSMTSNSMIMDVTTKVDDRVAFGVVASGGGTVTVGNDRNDTYATFIKLGDT